MERVITVISTRMSGKKVFNSNATTLGELKSEMDANGIDYEGMDFLEGLSHTSMIDDEAILPSNIERKGVVTNNLVFMLTDSNKKIKSGMDRSDIYIYIKNNNLADAIHDVFGRNFTNVTTTQLIDFIQNRNKKHVEENSKEYKYNIEFNNGESLYEAMKAIDALDTLEEAYLFMDGNKVKSPYSDEELDDIIDSFN